MTPSPSQRLASKHFRRTGRGNRVPDPLKERPFVVDLVIVVCNGCGAERKIPIDPPFRSAQEFITWQKSSLISRCGCGSPTADLKLRLADQN
jgi:hypothetical protein